MIFPPPLLFHNIGDFLCKNPYSPHIDIKEIVPFIQGKFPLSAHPRWRLRYSQEYRQRGNLFFTGFQHLIDILLFTHITGNRKHLHTALSFKLPGGRFKIFHFPGRNYDIRTRLRQSRGNEFPYTPARRPSRWQPSRQVLKRFCNFIGILLSDICIFLAHPHNKFSLFTVYNCLYLNCEQDAK